MLRKLAEQNQVKITGNKNAGSFSSRVAEGDYKFDEGGLHGKISGRGIAGRFSFKSGRAVITITDKPFWLPETLLKRKIAEGLDAFCNDQE